MSVPKRPEIGFLFFYISTYHMYGRFSRVKDLIVRLKYLYIYMCMYVCTYVTINVIFYISLLPHPIWSFVGLLPIFIIYL